MGKIPLTSVTRSSLERWVQTLPVEWQRPMSQFMSSVMFKDELSVFCLTDILQTEITGLANNVLTVVSDESGVEFDSASSTATKTSTTNFNNNLSSSDNTVQKALDTIDNLTLGKTVHNDLTNRNATACHPASAIAPSTTNFDKNLSSSDDTVQKALDTIDNLTIFADNVKTSVTNFDGKLSASDTEVQHALDTLDDHNHDAAYINVGGDTMTGPLTVTEMKTGGRKEGLSSGVKTTLFSISYNGGAMDGVWVDMIVEVAGYILSDMYRQVHARTDRTVLRYWGTINKTGPTLLQAVDENLEAGTLTVLPTCGVSGGVATFSVTVTTSLTTPGINVNFAVRHGYWGSYATL